MDDLVIRGGLVVDGIGAPGRTADVAIAGGRIRQVGGDIARGHREVSADGLLVAPGWVDVHTHYDGNVLWDPLVTPSSSHGVTTAVTGNCGVGFAPVRRESRDWTISLMEGVEDIPGEVLRRGLSWEWETYPEYLDAIDAVPRAIDVGTQVPHAALRVYVMGERGIDHQEVPTDDEIRRMGELAAEAIVAGALGFSTSRSRNHFSSDGRLTPTLTATAAELLGVARAIGATGRGVFEAVFEDGDIAPHLDLLRQVCEVSGRPLSLTTLQRFGQPSSQYRTILDGIERAVADGLAMRGQVAARPVGLLMSLKGRVHPLLGSPTYQAMAGRPYADRLAALAEPATRTRILEELHAGEDPMSRFVHAFELGDPPQWTFAPERSIRHQAAARRLPAVDVAYDVIAAGGMIFVPVANFVDGDLDAHREMLVHPLTVPGLGDGGAHCTMIADFDFPTFLLSYWARDAAEDQRVPVEWAIKRQCADTAALVGLGDRGILAPGKKADVNLIDLAALAPTAPRIIEDLPGGGSRLVSGAVGYVTTVVSGQVAFEGGVHTGALEGALVRGGRTAQGEGR
jgi:N-acyl-D-aspartate/D-glutamate deacylase